MSKKKADGTFRLSLDEVSQEIDLESYLGDKPTVKQKRLFADIAIDLMNNRTLDGKSIEGRKFTRYTPEYAKIKGVTVDSVDMFLKGDMLEGIDRNKAKENDGTVFLQMEKGLQTKKAFNHMTRKTKANPARKRSFFGVTDAEAKRITEEIKDKKKNGNTKTLAELRAALDILTIEQIE